MRGRDCVSARALCWGVNFRMQCAAVIVSVGVSSLATGRTLQSEQRERFEVIYGSDDRVDAALHPNAKFRELSRSVAGRVRLDQAPLVDGRFQLPADTLQETSGVCSSERFAQQRTVADCSGFLVGPDLLATAGHCAEVKAECDENAWVFDFIQGVDSIDAKNVYGCSEIVSQALNGNDDYAIIRLDRKVADRPALKVRQKGAVATTDTLVVIGHPSGLPLKIDGGGIVRSSLETQDFFVAELDTFGGNSGSPVINERTLEVEGILVRGERDYVFDSQKGCSVAKVCVTGSCRGEDVQKILNVPGLI